MRLKCEDIKLASSDTNSAIAYAQELFEATFANMDRTANIAPSTKRRGSRRSIPGFQSQEDQKWVFER